MSHTALQPILGGIYQTLWDARPLRFIGCNETEIHYDCWWPELQAWSFSGTRKSRVSFYRTSADAFLKGASLLEIRPLDACERQRFRPDLPLHLFRSSRLQWADLRTETPDSASPWPHLQPNSIYTKGMAVNELVLYPLRKNGSPALGRRVNLEGHAPDALRHLLNQAAQIQAESGKMDLQGIGLYRMGYDRDCPSYYLGGARDLAGLYKSID